MFEENRGVDGKGAEGRPGEARPDLYASGKQLPGTVYRVVRHLATGGMGSVYDVEDVTVGKRYVLKTLHPQLVMRDDLARRMEAEARTLAKLQHPNIVDVVTAGVTTDAWRMPFYVMERLNGQNLRVVLDKKGALEPAHCFRIAIDVLDALEHAHENNVLHRDVKPENIFLHRNISGTTITKLLDFGIMRLLDGKASHTHGKFIGTLRYASPEQIMGEKLGPASDIYALGVVLYEMLCGRGPFDDEGDAYAVGFAHAKKAPPPLSSFVRVPPKLQALEALVMKALAKRPEDRPRDSFTFAGELRRLSREQDVGPDAATAEAVLSSAPTAERLLAPSDSQVDRATGDAKHGAGTAAEAPAAKSAFTPPHASVASPVGETVLDPVSHPVSQSNGKPSHPPLARTSRPSFPTDPEPRERAPVAASEPRRIDRDALTRPSAATGGTRRLAVNGTMMDDGADAELHRALGERMPLEVMESPAGAAHELRFPPLPAEGAGTGTGPLAGEARTRPPERAWGISFLAMALFALVVVVPVTFVVSKVRAPRSAASADPPTPSVAFDGARGSELAAPASVEAADSSAEAMPSAEVAKATQVAEEATSASMNVPSALPVPESSARVVPKAVSPANSRPRAPAAAKSEPAGEGRRPVAGKPAVARPEDVGFD